MTRDNVDSVRIVRPREAASILGLGYSTIAKMRMRGDGPRFVRLGPKSVGYPLAALRAWLAARRRTSTRDTGKRRSMRKRGAR